MNAARRARLVTAVIGAIGLLVVLSSVVLAQVGSPTHIRGDGTLVRDGDGAAVVVQAPTYTVTSTPTRTFTPTVTGTPPTNTPTPTVTNTPTVTQTPTVTNTPTSTPTFTPVTVGGNIVAVSAAYTLPTGTPVAYAANDAISNSTSAPAALSFAGMCRVTGGSGYITKARLTTDQSTNVAQYRVWIFHTAPTPIADNAAFTVLWTNRTSEVGSIDLGPVQTEGSGSTAAWASDATIRVPYVCDAGSTTLSVLLETKTAFTPAVIEGFYLELTGDLN